MIETIENNPAAVLHSACDTQRPTVTQSFIENKNEDKTFEFFNFRKAITKSFF